MDFETLKTMIEDAGYHPYSYSGRGMYGAKCIGVTLSEFKHLSDIILQCNDVAAAADLIDTVSHDSMGRDMVFYWEEIEWENIEEELDETEEEA